MYYFYNKNSFFVPNSKKVHKTVRPNDIMSLIFNFFYLISKSLLTTYNVASIKQGIVGNYFKNKIWNITELAGDKHVCLVNKHNNRV